MLTVKVRDASRDEEVIFESQRVRQRFYMPDERTETAIGEVECDGVSYTIRPAAKADGSNAMTMWVMNRNGATVAHYAL